MNLGDYLVKPLAAQELVETVRWLIRERREYARMTAFVKQLRKAYDALFWDDKPVPPKVVAFLEGQVADKPNDRLTLETLAVAYARNRDWTKLVPVAARLTQMTENHGQRSEDLITSIVTMPVVHTLEVVDVRKEDADGCSVVMALLDGAPRGFHERSAVQQTGERIQARPLAVVAECDGQGLLLANEPLPLCLYIQ